MDAPHTPVAAGLIALAGLVLLAFLAGSVAIWVQAAMRFSRGEPLVAWQPRRCVPWSGLDLLLCAAFYLLAVAGASGVLRLLGREPAEEANDPARLMEVIGLNTLATLVGTACAIAAMRLRGATWQDLGLARGKLLADCRLGLAAFLFVGPGVYALQLVLSRFIEGQHPLVDMVRRGGTEALLFAVASALLVAPLCEEWLFRVLFQGWLEKLELLLTGLSLRRASVRGSDASPAAATTSQEGLLSPSHVELHEGPRLATTIRESDNRDTSTAHTTATEGDSLHERPAPGLLGLPCGTVPTILSSGVFAIMHSGQGPAPIPLFVFALCLGYLYRQTHRLLPSLVVHFCLNALSMLMLCVMVFSGLL